MTAIMASAIGQFVEKTKRSEVVIRKFTNDLKELLSQALRIIKTWSIENGLGVNIHKTELVMITRRHNISSKTQAKYLGIILERKLNLRSNIEERRKRRSIISGSRYYPRFTSHLPTFSKSN